MRASIFIILGSPNSSTGKLSDISKSRLDYCLNHHKKDTLVLCTGGWGKHFNTSSSSHAALAKQYLIEKGLLGMNFLDFALSQNTVDDAVKIKPIVSLLDNPFLTIITSDYHLDRVKLIFNQILKKYDMEFIGVESNLETKTYNALMLHEEKAIQSILKNGLYY